MIAETSNYFSILFAALAAFAWYKSARAEVLATPDQDTHGHGMSMGGDYLVTTFNGRRVELVASMSKQSRFNAIAAAFACLASAAQVLSFMATKFVWF